jgi:hypothetical protein
MISAAYCRGVRFGDCVCWSRLAGTHEIFAALQFVCSWPITTFIAGIISQQLSGYCGNDLSNDAVICEVPDARLAAV